MPPSLRGSTLVTRFRSAADEAGLKRLTSVLPGWPVVALVDVDVDPENLFRANRAGAAQIVPLALQPADFRAALNAVEVQFDLRSQASETIAFSSASGGCGGSTLAAAVAHEFATQTGTKTVLIEVAPQMGTLATNLNLKPKTGRGLAFATTCVTRQDEAIAAFGPERFDLVLIDYLLAQGDGLQLLLELRARDPVVPIIAVSGTATAEVAAELIRGGADDYFDKSNLDPNRFAASVRSCVERAAKLRTRVSAAPAAAAGQLAGLVDDFARRLGPDFFERLDRIVADLRGQSTHLADLETLFSRLSLPIVGRPVLLEIAARLFSDQPQT